MSTGPLFALHLEDGSTCPQPKGWVVLIDERPDGGGPHELIYVFFDLDGTRREHRADSYPVNWREQFSIAGF